jgi:hypothetical protein
MARTLLTGVQHPPNYRSMSIFFANNINHKGLQIDNIISVYERDKKSESTKFMS